MHVAIQHIAELNQSTLAYSRFILAAIYINSRLATIYRKFKCSYDSEHAGPVNWLAVFHGFKATATTITSILWVL